MKLNGSRRALLIAIGALAALPLELVGQAERRIRRIGYHSAGTSQSNAGWLDAFREGMAQLGWIDGRDYLIDARYADGSAAAVPRIANELVATAPDLLLAPGDASVRALAKATSKIPIVFAVSADPVGSGFAKSLQRPGGNLTGLTSLSPDLAAKRIELLKEASPKLAHIVLLYEPAEPSGIAQVNEYRHAARRLKLQLTEVELRQPADIDAAFDRARAVRADACAVATGFLVAAERKSVAAGAVSAKLPSIAPSAYFADAGALMTYGAPPAQHFRQAAGYVDRIFKGTRPGDLPIEQPTKYELVVNRKTANAIGLKLPSTILARADRVIE